MLSLKIFRQSRVLAALVVICFLGAQASAYAQAVANIPINSPYFLAVSQPFVPALLKGIKVDPNDPFKFSFVLDTGNSNLTPQQIKLEGEKLAKYFLAALAIPRKDMWVNLSPYEQYRIIPYSTGQTDLGETLLSQDYLLKQLAASLTYPETEAGKKYWDTINHPNALQGASEARDAAITADSSKQAVIASVGETRLPRNDAKAASTFQKVWIMPDYAQVYQEGDTAFITKARLKVMMEEDYVAQQISNLRGSSIESASNPGGWKSSQAFKTHILPLMLNTTPFLLSMLAV